MEKRLLIVLVISLGNNNLNVIDFNWSIIVLLFSQQNAMCQLDQMPEPQSQWLPKDYRMHFSCASCMIQLQVCYHGNVTNSLANMESILNSHSLNVFWVIKGVP